LLNFSIAMPIYAYHCSACHYAQDILRKISDAPLVTCTACGQNTFVKQVTAAAFALKGSGWYVTDFRGDASGSKSSDGTASAPKTAETASSAPKTAEVVTSSASAVSSPVLSNTTNSVATATSTSPSTP
jgi:putative FmdB family regulatory protein